MYLDINSLAASSFWSRTSCNPYHGLIDVRCHSRDGSNYVNYHWESLSIAVRMTSNRVRGKTLVSALTGTAGTHPKSGHCLVCPPCPGLCCHLGPSKPHRAGKMFRLKQSGQLLTRGKCQPVKSHWLERYWTISASGAWSCNRNRCVIEESDISQGP